MITLQYNYLEINKNFTFFTFTKRYTKEFLDKTKETPVSVARKKYPRPSAKELYDALKDHLSFIIVRHPFERLISAYRDKFSYPYDQYFKPLGEKIIKATRENVNVKLKNLLYFYSIN